MRILSPIVVLYLMQKGLNFREIMLLQSVNSVSIFLLEVPTGAIADKIGRKFSLTTSCIISAIGLALYVGTSTFYVLILAECLLGFGLSLKSGADSALLYDTLKKLGQADQYTKIQGKVQSYALLLQIISAVIIGFLYSIHVNLPYIVAISLLIVAAFVTSFFVEVDIDKPLNKSGYITHIKVSVNYILHHKKIKGIMLYSAFIFVFWRIGFWYYQPYMHAVHIDVRYIGILFALFNLTAALSSRHAHSIIHWMKDWSLVLLGTLFFCSFLLMGWTQVFWGVVFIALQETARGIRRPILLKYINELIPSNKRATIISFKSFAENLALAIAYPLVGIVMDHIEIIRLHTYTSLIVLIGTIWFYHYFKTTGVIETYKRKN